MYSDPTLFLLRACQNAEPRRALCAVARGTVETEEGTQRSMEVLGKYFRAVGDPTALPSAFCIFYQRLMDSVRKQL